MVVEEEVLTRGKEDLALFYWLQHVNMLTSNMFAFIGESDDVGVEA